MIGMFAVSEIIRYVVDTSPAGLIVEAQVGNVFKGMWALAKKYPTQILRGSVLGTAVAGSQPVAVVVLWIAGAAALAVPATSHSWQGPVVVAVAMNFLMPSVNGVNAGADGCTDAVSTVRMSGDLHPPHVRLISDSAQFIFAELLLAWLGVA